MNKDIDIMNKIALIVAVILAAALIGPANADTTIKSQDGTVQLTIPNGWREGKPFSPVFQLQAVNAAGAMVLVRVVSKEDFKDLKSFADVSLDRLKRNMADAEPKVEDLQINNKPAIRVSMEGTTANGQRRGYLITFFESGASYVGVVGIAAASAFKAAQDTFAALAGQVQVLTPEAAVPPPQQTQTPPAAPPPSGKPPTTRPPR
jgi:hypothetical protein